MTLVRVYVCGRCRSHIVHLLRQTSYGWIRFTEFQGRYRSAFDQPCQELDVGTAADDLVDILGQNKLRVIIFKRFSPKVCVKKKPSLMKRLVRLMENRQGIPLLK